MNQYFNLYNMHNFLFKDGMEVFKYLINILEKVDAFITLFLAFKFLYTRKVIILIKFLMLTGLTIRI